MTTKTDSMFLLSVPSNDYNKPMVTIGLFESAEKAHAYMEQFQTVWVWECEQFRNIPVGFNGPFITVAKSAEEILARYPEENIKVYGKAKNPKAYMMDREDVEDGFCRYNVTEIPVL